MTYRVFLSSTGADLQDYRDAAYEAIRMTGATCVRMEDFEADPRRPVELCADEVAYSDMLIGLIGFHYGGRVPPEETRSFTEEEINTAAAQDPAIPCYFYVAPAGSVPATDQSGADLDAQRTLRNRLLSDYTVGRPEHWESPYRLALQIMPIVFKAMQETPIEAQYAARLKVEVLDREQRSEHADPETKQTLFKEKAALKQKLNNIVEEFGNLSSNLNDLLENLRSNDAKIGKAILTAFEDAVARADIDEADLILSQIQEDSELEDSLVALIAYGRGEVADAQVRWEDAADHFFEAAHFAPNFETLNRSARAASRVDRLDYAVNISQVLVDLTRRELDENNPLSILNASAAQNNLANVYCSIGEYELAAQCIQISLKSDRELFGKQHISYAKGLANLANIQREAGCVEVAEALYRQSVNIIRGETGEITAYHGWVIGSLGNLLREMGDYEDAEPYLEQAEKLLSGSANYLKEYAVILNNLGCIYRETKRFEKSGEYLKNSLEITKSILGTNHSEYGVIMLNFGSLLTDLGQYEKAYEHNFESYRILHDTLGTDHPKTVFSGDNLYRFLADFFPHDPMIGRLIARYA